MSYELLSTLTDGLSGYDIEKLIDYVGDKVRDVFKEFPDTLITFEVPQDKVYNVVLKVPVTKEMCEKIL